VSGPVLGLDVVLTRSNAAIDSSVGTTSPRLAGNVSGATSMTCFGTECVAKIAIISPGNENERPFLPKRPERFMSARPPDGKPEGRHRRGLPSRGQTDPIMAKPAAKDEDPHWQIKPPRTKTSGA